MAVSRRALHFGRFFDEIAQPIYHHGTRDIRLVPFVFIDGFAPVKADPALGEVFRSGNELVEFFHGATQGEGFFNDQRFASRSLPSSISLSLKAKN